MTDMITCLDLLSYVIEVLKILYPILILSKKFPDLKWVLDSHSIIL